MRVNRLCSLEVGKATMSQGCKLLKNHDSVRGADEPFNNRDAKRTKRESKDELTTNTCVRVSEDESKMNTCAESKEEAQGNTSSDEDKERDRKDDRVLESQSGEGNNSGSDSSATSDSDEEEEKTPTATNGLSAYEQLRAERIARNMARLVSIGVCALCCCDCKSMLTPSNITYHIK